MTSLEERMKENAKKMRQEVEEEFKNKRRQNAINESKATIPMSSHEAQLAAAYYSDDPNAVAHVICRLSTRGEIERDGLDRLINKYEGMKAAERANIPQVDYESEIYKQIERLFNNDLETWREYRKDRVIPAKKDNEHGFLCCGQNRQIMFDRDSTGNYYLSEYATIPGRRPGIDSDNVELDKELRLRIDIKNKKAFVENFRNQNRIVNKTLLLCKDRGSCLS